MSEVTDLSGEEERECEELLHSHTRMTNWLPLHHLPTHVLCPVRNSHSFGYTRYSCSVC